MILTEQDLNMHPRYGVRRYRNNEVGVRIIADEICGMHIESEIEFSMQSYSIAMAYTAMHGNSGLHELPLKSRSERIKLWCA